MSRSVVVSTSQYQFAHGRAPRGRGCWLFYFGFGRRSGGTVDPWSPGPGEKTYSDAKRAAVAHALASGFSFVEVAS